MQLINRRLFQFSKRTIYNTASEIKSTNRQKMNLYTAVNNALDIELGSNPK